VEPNWSAPPRRPLEPSAAASETLSPTRIHTEPAPENGTIAQVPNAQNGTQECGGLADVAIVGQQGRAERGNAVSATAPITDARDSPAGARPAPDTVQRQAPGIAASACGELKGVAQAVDVRRMDSDRGWSDDDLQRRQSVLGVDVPEVRYSRPLP
jgi:hypothetical protein